MTVFLVLSMFVVILLVDTLLHRTPVQVAAPKTQPQTQPRLLPSLVGGFKVMDNLRYHPGHTWAVSESPELARVGIRMTEVHEAVTRDLKNWKKSA